MDDIKAVETLSGFISAECTLVGNVSCAGGLTGKMSAAITKVPYWETSNSSNGMTAYIAKEV